ncbi:hypothetical protein [Thermoactinospora rubra]|uniref:hypothetical protein n=1 Tax=Thermoactinospora rubra TaxID=1088767 RepID=UPI000A116175|nr:hypothetical protein [Thermoactinospora rubra]
MGDVDNPKYEYLKNLQERVHKIQGEMEKKLNKPAAAMDSGKVWTSKTATAWKGRLDENVRAYNTALGALDDELSAVLASTPRKCSQEEADKWYRELNAYNRTMRFQ